MPLGAAAVLVFGVAAGAAGSAFEPMQQADAARQLLQRAVHLEEAMGDPEAAIATYERVLAATDADAPLAAAAEFRLATLLSKLGRSEEAREHHRRITDLYARDSRLEEIVRLARAALGEEVRRGTGAAMVARRLWEGSQSYAYGSLSPDGSFLSFVDWASPNRNLAVHDLDRGIQRFLTDTDAGADTQTGCSSSVVAPSGRQIAYVWQSPARGHSIHIVGRGGTPDRTVLDSLTGLQHIELEGWSADGAFLLAIFYSARGNSLQLVSAATGDIWEVLDLGSETPEKASLSPDGRWIAYHHVAATGSAHDVYLVSADGTRASTLVSHPANDLLPVWTPDGRHVLFVSDRAGTLGAWMIEVANGERRGEPRMVKPDFGRSIPMGFTNYGAFVYALQLSISDIYTAKLDFETGELTERIASSGRFVGVNRSPVWSPDGRKLAYLSDRGSLPSGFGQSTLIVRDLESSTERVLNPPLHKIAEPRWHPDGDAILVLGINEDRLQAVFRIDIDNGSAERFISWEDAGCRCVSSHAVSPLGTHLAYFRPQGIDERGDLVVRDLQQAAERVLARGLNAADVGSLEFSADGTMLAAAVRRRRAAAEGWSLEVFAVDGRGSRQIAALGSEADAVAVIGWTDGDDGVLFVRGEPDGSSLRWVSATGVGAKTLIADLPRDVRGIRLHPDGQTLVYTSGQSRSEIWMLENLSIASAGAR